MLTTPSDKQFMAIGHLREKSIEKFEMWSSDKQMTHALLYNAAQTHADCIPFRKINHWRITRVALKSNPIQQCRVLKADNEE